MAPLKCAPQLLTRDLSGKVYLITGANSGIGLFTTLQLAKQGAHVIMGCRRIEAGEEAAKDASEMKGSVEVVRLDLADLSSVRECAKVVNEKHAKLDALVNNAGIMGPPYSETVDGFESQFGTNHLGHFLLTELLLDLLKKSAPSRIINISSCVHEGTSTSPDASSRPSIDLDDLKWEKRGYNNMDAYHSSKLANLLHARALAKRLDGTGVTSVSVHPGWVRTNLARFLMPDFVQNIVMRPFYGFIGLISVKDGSQTMLHTILDDDIPDHDGQYFAQSGNFFHNPKSKNGGWPLTSTNPNAHDDTLTENLYVTSRKLVGLD